MTNVIQTRVFAQRIKVSVEHTYSSQDAEACEELLLVFKSSIFRERSFILNVCTKKNFLTQRFTANKLKDDAIGKVGEGNQEGQDLDQTNVHFPGVLKERLVLLLTKISDLI